MLNTPDIAPAVQQGPALLRDISALVSSWDPSRPVSDLIAALSDRSNLAAPAAVPRKRKRGKCMSRRRGQKVKIEPHGGWYTFRARVDVEGQVKRPFRRFKVSPIDPAAPGWLSESQCHFKAGKMMAALEGRNEEVVESEEHGGSGTSVFEPVKQPVLEPAELPVLEPAKPPVPTFAQQVKIFLAQAEADNPAEGTTILRMKGLKNWLLPVLGEMPIDEITNSTIRELVGWMKGGPMPQKGVAMPNGTEPGGNNKPLAASSIRFMLGIVKQVRSSAVDEHGDQIYPYTWNDKYIKVPKVRRKDMKRPSITPDIMTDLAKIADIFYRVLFILLGATGARIGEMLAVEIDKHISPDFRTILIRQKLFRGKISKRLKTEASLREVDLHPAVSELLKWFVGDRKSGFLFPGQWAGHPVGYSTVARHLHEELKKLGYDNDYDHTSKAGSHIFRRFRVTYLRNVVFCPEGLRHFWLGHAKDDERDGRDNNDEMGAWYDTIGKDRPFRLQKAEECGFGFNLPSDVPNVPKFPTRKRTPRRPRKNQSNQADE